MSGKNILTDTDSNISVRLMPKTAAGLLIALTFFSINASCITTYSDFPQGKIGAPPPAKQYDKLYYYFAPLNILEVAGGYTALKKVVSRESPFDLTEAVPVIKRGYEESPVIPEKGLFLNVDVKWKPPSLPAIAFLYLSAATATLLPAWSNQEGYIITYSMYVDGKLQRQQDYTVERDFYVWLPLVCVSPVNFATYTEQQAFVATGKQYFSDMEAWLAKNGKR